MNEWKQYIDLIIATVLSVLASLITALLSSEKVFWKVVRTFLAGSVFGFVSQGIMIYFHFDSGYKVIISVFGAAFVSSVWPVLRKGTNKAAALGGKYFNKKIGSSDGDDSIQNNERH